MCVSLFPDSQGLFTNLNLLLVWYKLGGEGGGIGIRRLGFQFWLWHLLSCELGQIVQEPQFLVCEMSLGETVWEDTTDVTDFSCFSLHINQNCFLATGSGEKEALL